MELLCGDRRKSKKNPIETLAIQLAQAVENEWFQSQAPIGRPSGKWNRNTGTPPGTLLTIYDLVTIAAPVIEEFSRHKIRRGSVSFDALLWTAYAYSDVISRKASSRKLHITPELVYQALSRARRELRALSEEVAPET